MKHSLKAPALVIIILSFALAAVLLGCDSLRSSRPHPEPVPDGGGSPLTPAQRSPEDLALSEMYQADVAEFAWLDSTVLEAFNTQDQGLFAQIFGGTSASDVIQYYNDRVHSVLTPEGLNEATMSPASFPNQGWLTEAHDSGQLLSILGVPDASQSGGKIVIGALNISTMLWLEGVVNDSPVMVTVDGTEIPIDSPRVGLILLGEGYQASFTDDNGVAHDIPAAFRQAILVHEARHSDCTGGLPADELAAMKAAASIEEYRKLYPSPHCGHLHVICPSGTYQGIAACDVEKFGAYRIGAEYESAMIGAAQDDLSRKILQVSALDYLSRFLGSAVDGPDETTPNMTSEGLTASLQDGPKS